MNDQELLDVVPNSVVDRDGVPRFGGYRGELPAIDFKGLKGRHTPKWWHWRLRRKRWHYTIVVTDEVLVCQATVDGGFFGQGFMYVVDLYEQRCISEQSYSGAPGWHATVNDRPGGGHRSRFRTSGVEYSLCRGDGERSYRWNCRLHPFRQRHPDGLRLDAAFDVDDVAPALTVISPVDGGGLVNVTQKWAGLPVAGRLRVGSRSYRLDDGLAGLDYTQGILARRTNWRWAQGMGRLYDGRRIGLNLVAGFNDGHSETGENALWIGDRLIPLGRAEFEFSREHPDRPWMVRTLDDRVRLHFQPYYVYSDNRQWRVVDTHFLQPAGRFEASIEIDGRRHDATLFGVTEDQDVYW